MQSEELKNVLAYHKDNIVSAEDCFLIDSFDSSETKITVGVMFISVELDNSDEERLFEICPVSTDDNDSANPQQACIEIDGIAITVFESIDEIEGFALHGLDFNECVEKIWNTKSEDIQKWNKFRNKYSDLAEWHNELSKISDGYENINREEIEEALSDAIDFRIEIVENIYLHIREGYLSYNHSTIKDLSVVNGVDMFSWQGIDFADNYVCEFLDSFWKND